MKNYLLLGLGLIIFSSIVLAAEADCGLRGYDGSAIVKFACDSTANSSLIKISKSGTTYGVLLVPTNDSTATKFRIKTSSGVMALKRYAPVACGNGVCESNESKTNCPADCSCAAITSTTSGTCTSCMGGLGSCVASANPTLAIAPYYLCTHSGYTSYTTWYISSTTYCGTNGWKCTCPFGNGVCEPAYGENCSNDPADCTCNTSAGYYCSSGTCVNHFGNGVCESSLSETCLNTPDCACSSGLTCISGSCLWLTWKGGAIQTSLLYCTGNGCYIGAGNSPCSTYGAVCEMCVSEGIFPEYNCGYGPDGFYCDTTWVQRYQFQRFICS